MATLARAALLALVGAGSSLRLASCVDLVHETTLYPDGSGRFVVTWGSSKSMTGTDSPADTVLSQWTPLAEGVAAWGEPTMKVEGGSVFYTMTAYFEDINKFRWHNDPKDKEREDLLTFEFKKAGRGGSLTIEDKCIKNAKEEAAKPPDKGTNEAGNDRYWSTLAVPGKIKGSKGFHEIKDRRASIRFIAKTVSDAQGGNKDALKLISQLSTPMTLSWESTDATEAEIAAFQKEFAAARESWKTLSPRLQKIREEEEKKKKED